MTTPQSLPTHYTAFAPDQECELVTYHAPLPVMIEYHHTKPVFLQNYLYGKIVHGPDQWVCGNCHDAVHAWLYYLLGEHRKPPRVGRLAKEAAEKIYQWYTDECRRLGKVP